MLPALSGCSLCSRPATGTCGALVAFATPKSLLTAPERQSRPPPPPSSCSAAERPHPLTPTHTYSLSPRSSSPPANAMACTLTTPTAVLAGTPVAKRTLRSRRPAAAACQQQRRRLFKVAAAAEPEPKAGSVQVGACQPRASLAVLAPARCRTHAPGLHPPAPNTARPAACLPAATGANRRPAWPPPPTAGLCAQRGARAGPLRLPQRRHGRPGGHRLLCGPWPGRGHRPLDHSRFHRR